MNKLVLAIIISAYLFLAFSCKQQNIEDVTVYEQARSEQFDDLIAQLQEPYDLSDTLYTEMYIALKAMDRDDACGDTVLNRVSSLLQIDTIQENRRHYIEAATIVYSTRKDYDNFWKMSLLS